jgi:hypothetical protein
MRSSTSDKRHELALESFLCPSAFYTWPVEEQIRLQIAVLDQLLADQIPASGDDSDRQRLAAWRVKKGRRQLIGICAAMGRANGSSLTDVGDTGGEAKRAAPQ